VQDVTSIRSQTKSYCEFSQIRILYTDGVLMEQLMKHHNTNGWIMDLKCINVGFIYIGGVEEAKNMLKYSWISQLELIALIEL